MNLWLLRKMSGGKDFDVEKKNIPLVKLGNEICV